VVRYAWSFVAVGLLCCSTAEATPIKGSATTVQQIRVVSDVDLQNIATQCSTGYADVPGATVKLTIPSGVNQLLMARFTGDVVTSGDGFVDTQLRIVMGTREMNPVAPRAVSSNADAYEQPVAIERSTIVGPGSRVVQVQACVNGDNTAYATVSGWHLSVEAAPVQ
jgi:hypothetical protein